MMKRFGGFAKRTAAFALSAVMAFGCAMTAYAEESIDTTVAAEEIETAASEVEKLESYGEEVKDKLEESAQNVEATATQLEAATEALNAALDLDAEVQANEDIVVAFADGQADYDTASAALERAEAKRLEAETQIADARAALDAAKEVSADAQEAMEAAEELIQTLEAEKNDLEAIQNQYYAVLTSYYNDLRCAVYNEDGTLNVEASAAKAVESGKIDAKASNPNGNVMKYCRQLMEQLIAYMINSNDPETEDLEIAKTGKTAKQALDAASGTEHTQKWDNVSGNGGRNNHVTVTYVDGDGNQHTEFYNYEFKSSVYGDDMNMENGPVYLALVQKDADGNWSAVKVEDENNFDDYQKLVNAVSALNNYAAATAAVTAAKAEVTALAEKVSALEAASLHEASPAYLAAVEALAEAKAALEAAEQNKAALAAPAAAANNTVATINLAQFNIQNIEEVEVVTVDEIATEEEAVVNEEIAAVEEAAPATAEVVTPVADDTAVLGAEVAPVVENVVIEEDLVPMAAAAEEAKEEEISTEESIAEDITAEGTEISMISDEEVSQAVATQAAQPISL